MKTVKFNTHFDINSSPLAKLLWDEYGLIIEHKEWLDNILKVAEKEIELRKFTAKN